MKFKKDYLVEMLYEEPIYEVGCGKRRWSETMRRIFAHEGKLYETFWERGHTEQQDISPYEGKPDEIECPEVVETEHTVIVKKYTHLAAQDKEST